ncbi:MAG: adenosylhomocysteinase, partial [Actinomycetota bacterium]|nr:adenosylhomocysteinase [Actinomycetota bacterium]
GEGMERLEFADGRHAILITGGRMFNLGGANPKGNSLESMDLGFLLQSLSLERVVTNPASLTAGAQPVPDDINREIARRFVAALDAAR